MKNTIRIFLVTKNTTRIFFGPRFYFSRSVGTGIFGHFVSKSPTAKKVDVHPHREASSDDPISVRYSCQAC